ncbi:MAG: phosphate ABC transporter substrate-binding protein PstS [Gallionella sp.]|nr:phosphate ABC transporter substrate-binding protein PstS [Gallionella sp.]
MADYFIRKIGLAALLLAAGIASASDFITGAGATFPYPAYLRWFNGYQMEAGIGVYYNPIGSSGGVEKILSNTVDFGATDAPMTQEELEKNGLIQFPTLIGGVVPVINLDGVAEGQLKLSGNVLADIFLGKITRWNDAHIVADNNGVKLPNQEINVVHRVDGSGTTFVFTTYLSQVSPEWKSSMGTGNIVPWKTGIGIHGGGGMASYVKSVSGSIGYLEYTSTMQDKMNYAQLKNHDGNFVKPSAASFKAASLGIESSRCFCESMINKPGHDAWPITSATFILIRKSAGAKKVLKFFEWAFDEDDKKILDMGYVQLPRKVWKGIVGTCWNQIPGGRFKTPWN